MKWEKGDKADPIIYLRAEKADQFQSFSVTLVNEIEFKISS
jgi:hypothetical protein